MTGEEWPGELPLERAQEKVVIETAEGEEDLSKALSRPRAIVRISVPSGFAWNQDQEWKGHQFTRWSPQPWAQKKDEEPEEVVKPKRKPELTVGQRVLKLFPRRRRKRISLLLRQVRDLLGQITEEMWTKTHHIDVDEGLELEDCIERIMDTLDPKDRPWEEGGRLWRR